ncbi:MAG: clostripain-related cysteine peptidase [Thermoleophilaceae bacterium]
MPAKWTFMVYMAGFNNLSDFATKDLKEMRKVGSSEEVKLAAFVKRQDGRGAEQLVVAKRPADDVQKNIGNADSGKPQTMLDFIRWAHQKAPAERYALVVWNHGSGWQPDDLDDLYDEVRGKRDLGVTPRELAVRSNQKIARSMFGTTVQKVLELGDPQLRGIASDDGTGHSLDTIELDRVLAKAHEEIGRPFDLLGMDACLMSALEVAYETRANVLNVVGSEELEPADGWPYTAILKDLAAKPNMDGARLGEIVVKRYIQSYSNRRRLWPVTQCATTTEGLKPFSSALDELAKALRTHMRQHGVGQVQAAHLRTAAFMGDLFDLRDFAAELRRRRVGTEVKRAAKKLVDSLAPNGYVLAEGHRGDSVKQCGGVTAYLPFPGGHISPYYKDLRFAKQHRWDDFVRGYHRAARSG